MPSWATHCDVGNGLVSSAASMRPADAGTGATAPTGWDWVAVRPAGDAIGAATAEELCAKAMSNAAAPVPSAGIDLCAGVCRKVETPLSDENWQPRVLG